MSVMPVTNSMSGQYLPFLIRIVLVNLRYLRLVFRFLYLTNFKYFIQIIQKVEGHNLLFLSPQIDGNLYKAFLIG